MKRTRSFPSSTIERWKADTLQGTEYTEWIALLENLKARYTATPNRMLQMVNAFAPQKRTKRPRTGTRATEQPGSSS